MLKSGVFAVGIGLSRLWKKKKKKIEKESLDEVKFLRSRGTTLFLDVGANTGQTGLGIRSAGWEGRIVSFEPLPDCYEALSATAKSDSNWESFNLAVGDKKGVVDMGVSRNRVSSSIRKTTDLLTTIFEPITVEETIQVNLTTLDDVFEKIASVEDIVHLKIDTQGFERNVIQGAVSSLPRIDTVRMEVASTEGYEGEMTVAEAITMMKELGFSLVDIWSGWRHPRTKEVLDYDLLFRSGTITA